MATYYSSEWTGRRPNMPRVSFSFFSKYFAIDVGRDMMRNSYTARIFWGKREAKEYECLFKHQKVITLVTKRQIEQGYY